MNTWMSKRVLSPQCHEASSVKGHSADEGWYCCVGDSPLIVYATARGRKGILIFFKQPRVSFFFTIEKWPQNLFRGSEYSEASKRTRVHSSALTQKTEHGYMCSHSRSSEGRAETRESLGLADCQPSSGFNKKPYVKGVTQEMIE